MCFNDLEDTLLPHEAPILSYDSGENSAMDFVCSDINCRVAWAQGLSLAYRLQTCTIVGNGSNNWGQKPKSLYNTLSIHIISIFYTSRHFFVFKYKHMRVQYFIHIRIYIHL